MQRLAIAGILVVILPSLGFAHVSVRPRESKAGAEERYVVRVPTEGTVATDYVRLEIPKDVSILEVLAAEGATFEMTKEGGQATAITWSKAIPPKAVTEFVFRARNPDSGDIVWKAHQHFGDGTTADWIGAPGERRPAAVTKLTSGDHLGGLQVSESDAAVRRRDQQRLDRLQRPRSRSRWVLAFRAGDCSSVARKRIANRQAAFDHLAVLEVFRVERCALRFQCSCRNQSVVELESVLICDADASVMAMN